MLPAIERDTLWALGFIPFYPQNSVIDNGCQALPSTIEGTLPLKPIKAVPLLHCICFHINAYMKIKAKLSQYWRLSHKNAAVLLIVPVVFQ